MEKGASMYSSACNSEKYKPKIIVRAIDWVASIWFPPIKEWWAHVTVTPEARRIAVFNKGIWKGLSGLI